MHYFGSRDFGGARIQHRQFSTDNSVYINDVSGGVRSVSGQYLNVHLDLGINRLPTTPHTVCLELHIF